MGSFARMVLDFTFVFSVLLRLEYFQLSFSVSCWKVCLVKSFCAFRYVSNRLQVRARVCYSLVFQSFSL